MFFIKPEFLVETPKDNDKVQAIVVILGWFNSKQKHIKKYSLLYHDQQCVTMMGVIDSLSFIVGNENNIYMFVQQMVHEVAELLRQHPNAPLIVHAFSNGGAVVVERLERGLMQYDSKMMNNDWKLVKDRYNATVFDSSPAFISRKVVTRAVKASFSQSFVLRNAFMAIFWMFAAWHDVWRYISDQPSIPEQYWDHWTNSPVLCPTQAYIYSTVDPITMPVPIQELSKHRASKGVNVIEKMFEDTDHVLHYRKHPKEYQSVITQVLAMCTNKKTK